MTLVEELSVQFDVLYNNIASNQAPGLNAYEKSVLLTKAQLEVIKNHFNPLGNKYNEGFDMSAKRQTDFSTLIKTESKSEVSNNNIVKINPASKLFTRPDALILINETLMGGTTPTFAFKVTPITPWEYGRLMQKPYKYPPKDCAWRLNNIEDVTTGGTSYVEILAKFAANTTYTYVTTFVKKPYPIIVENLGSTLTIDGQSNKTADTSLSIPKELLPEVLDRAIELARMYYTESSLQNITALNQRSE